MLQRPVFSNQHGALVMAAIPFFYGIFAGQFTVLHYWLGLSWLFAYLCSYPFFALFSKNPSHRYKLWAMIYGIFTLLFAIPLLIQKASILQFLLPILPLVLVQIYYAKQKDERNLINDIAGILTFGIVGMASYYLATERYNFEILLHPTLFFICTTLYIKSIARERRNPLYLKLSIGVHLLFCAIYLLYMNYPLFFAYFIGLVRAMVIPNKKLNIKQVGLLEFPVAIIFFICLIY